ncbi:MAG: hypothetical protein HRU20_04350 [Pseudomonadales bacterium]|nr:hypothetical protein [Pseudomonadales bacterium]
MTAHNSVYHRDKSLDAGMDDYLKKPIKLQRLKQFLQKVTALRAAIMKANFF